MLPNSNTNNAQANNYGYGYGYGSQPSGPTGLNYIVDIIKMFLYHWYWFVIGVAITLFVCRLYLLYTPPVYTRTASIMIKNDTNSKNNSSGTMNFMYSNVDVNNELFTLKSPNIMDAVVRRLHLDMNYMVQGRFHEAVIYGSSLGVDVVTDSLRDNETFEFEMELKKNRVVTMKNFVHNGVEKSGKVEAKVGERVKTPVGNLMVRPLETYQGQTAKIRVNRTSISKTISKCMKKLSATSQDEFSTIINLRYDDYNIERAEDVLSMVIAVYNENWVKDKNRVSISTSQFITERLGVIEQELGDVESDISDYKSENLIPASAVDAGNMYVGQATSAAQNLTELQSQLYMARYVRNYINNEKNANQLLPTNQGADIGLNSQISEYNTLLLRRNNILSASSLQNTLVKEMDKKLAELRKSLLASIDNQIAAINANIRASQTLEGKANTQIAKSPKQAKHLLSIERQQKVKESLYLYLLQKREENELSQAFTAYNTRVISAPSGKNEPTSPVESTAWIIAVLIGLAVPGVILFLRENINTSVRGRRDLAELTIPFIGELPYAVHSKSLMQRVQDWIKKIRRLGKPEKEDKTLHLVVKERSRNYINEAFRVVRTNIEFMSARGEKSKVIMLSSFNPNSGKTFVATNLITSFAIKNKKIIAIDLDLRKASLSAMVGKPEEGVSDYLSGIIPNYEDVIVRGKTHPNLDILPVGTIPPNPTELLFEDRLGQMINELREKYDYVFIDCPPVEIVADPTIVGKFVDMTLFIIRAELLDRTMLPEVQKYYDKERLPKMSIILNGTSSQFSYYGYGRYGYHRYGYYGYGSYGGYASK